MNMKSFLRAGGMTVLAAAMALPPIAAQAQDGRSISPNARGVAERVERAQRATQIENRASQRADRIERNGDRAAREAAQRGNVRQAERMDRQSEQAARRVEQQANRRAQQVMRGQDRPPQVRDNDRRNVDRNRPDRPIDRDRNWNNRDRTPNWRGNDNRRPPNARPAPRPGQQRWDRNWRNDNRYNWNQYRQSNRRLYSPGRYSAPYNNYSYRRVGIGFALDSLFFSNRYWINDPWQYRLPAVYGPYRWVRYYDDVLLVDTYTGEVVDVIYDFFW